MVFWKKKNGEKSESQKANLRNEISSERWKVGDRIENRYEIHQIKKGGMGIVYLCYDHKFKEPVAIKTFQDKYLADKASIDRFMWEAETWVRLEKHKNIVRAHYVQNISDRPYIFLEYVPGDKTYGSDLTGWIWKKGLDLNTSLSFAIQFCLGMEHAERKFREIGKPFVHRDIKPGNIMVTQDKVVKVTDFGLVKTFGRDVNVDAMKDESTGAERCGFSIIGNICGTPPYMSPEQCSGKEDIDIRSDIYSFGCVLYEMLTGKLPFNGPARINYIAQHLKEKPVPLKKIKTNIPDVLNNLVMRCLEKESERRYQDFKELRESLCDIYLQKSGVKFKLEETPQELEAGELGNKGTSLANLGKLQEAIVCFDKALKLNPQDAMTWYNIGFSLDNLGKHQEAIVYYDKALELNPQFASAWHNKGMLLGSLDKLQEAINCFDRALELNSQDVSAWHNKGVTFQNLGKYQEAIVCYDKALEINPQFAEVWFAKGYALLMQGKRQDTIACFEMWLKMNPRDAKAWNSKVNALLHLGNPQNAIASYDGVLEINPDAEAWLDKGNALSDSGKPQDAITCYDRALEIDPGYAEVWGNKGNALINLGKPQDAIACYDKVLAINSEDIKAWCNKGNALANLGKPQEAINCYDRALEIDPGHATAWYDKHNVLWNLDKPQEAINHYDRALEIDSRDAMAWYSKGVALDKLGKHQEAIDAYQNFIKFAPPQYAAYIEDAKEEIRELGGKV